MNPAGERYTRRTVKNVQLINVLAGISWVFLVYMLDIINADGIGLVLLSIPLIIFYINFSNAPRGSTRLEAIQYRGDYLAFASITMLILIHWAKVEGEERTEFYKIILTAFIFIMLSLLYVWPSQDNNSLYLHGRSILQTTGLVLLAYALYKYYLVQSKNPYSKLSLINSDFENISATAMAATGT